MINYFLRNRVGDRRRDRRRDRQQGPPEASRPSGSNQFLWEQPVPPEATSSSGSNKALREQPGPPEATFFFFPGKCFTHTNPPVDSVGLSRFARLATKTTSKELGERAFLLQMPGVSAVAWLLARMRRSCCKYSAEVWKVIVV